MIVTRSPLIYPKIPGSRTAPLSHCIAFEKYDGTNIHWVWNRELGWHAFGTRRDRFDLDESGIRDFKVAHPGLKQCAAVFLTSLAWPLTDVLTRLQYYGSSEIIVFTEFLGNNSFAGKHLFSAPKRLVVIDLQTDKGFLSPQQFTRDLRGLPIARAVYRGKFTGQFATQVREGKFGVTEGVVCKGEIDGKVWMAKIKTNAYEQHLKRAFGDKWESYWE